MTRAPIGRLNGEETWRISGPFKHRGIGYSHHGAMSSLAKGRSLSGTESVLFQPLLHQIGMLMKRIVLSSLTLLAVASFTYADAAEDPDKVPQDQAAATVQKSAPADKQPSQPSPAQIPIQPPAKPSMVEYCREHTC